METAFISVSELFYLFMRQIHKTNLMGRMKEFGLETERLE